MTIRILELSRSFLSRRRVDVEVDGRHTRDEEGVESTHRVFFEFLSIGNEATDLRLPGSRRASVDRDGSVASPGIESAERRGSERRRLQKFRWWVAAAAPFVAFYLAGLVLEARARYAAKALLLLALSAALHALARALLDDELRAVLPLSVYLATKVGAGPDAAIPSSTGPSLPRSDAPVTSRCAETTRR